MYFGPAGESGSAPATRAKSLIRNGYGLWGGPGTGDALVSTTTQPECLMNAKAKILIVDDEEVVRLSFVRVLARANCEVP